MKRIIILLLLIELLAGLHAIQLKQHQISIVLEPSKHFLKATDRIAFDRDITKSDTLYLPSSLKITTIKAGRAKIKYKVQADSTGYNSIVLYPKKSISDCTITYDGVVYYALQGRNLNQGHDFSRGMISEAKGEGIFLPAGSWYPVSSEEGLSTYSVKAQCPRDFSLITSGTETKTQDDQYNHYNWNTEIPAEGLTLCGNRFVVNERIVENKRLAVYLLPEEKDLAKTYLDAMQDIYVKYTNLLGAYPFSSFSMVENFFASGFGMPNYTLLAKDIVKMPFIVTAPGSLAHEFCHNWWGNSVMVEPGSGNWCEALTSFCANYYWNVMNGDEARQLDYRKQAIFAINQLPADKNYPLAEFHYQRNDDDAVIGYQKGSMFLYQLYKFIPDNGFFIALKNFSNNYKGKYATWKDLESEIMQVFPAEGSIDIERIFHEYLYDTSLPHIKIKEVSYQGNHGQVTISQGQPYFVLQVPIKLDNGKDFIIQDLSIREETASLPIYGEGLIKKIEIDPNYEMLRAINEQEMPFNMNRVMSANPLLILPVKGPELDKLTMLVMMLKQGGYEFTSIPADSVNEVMLKDRNIVIFGKYEDNLLYTRLINTLPAGFSIGDGFLVANRKEYKGSKASLLMSCTNPFNPGKMMTVYTWNGEDAVPSFRKMFHYQTQSWQVFDLDREANKPIESGDLYPKASSDLVWGN
ncbi:MAG TPA: M1 family aminopeptidase [Candidatus Cloacimonadota bacterium]|nr:M1 family aminopeptidase [Candidatus Cloacimonadota bacterium]HPT72752.1 M1 family aminopeptidase [Candidatus Cloacimonadota bacterium]